MTSELSRSHAVLALVVAIILGASPPQGSAPFDVLSLPGPNFGSCVPLGHSASTRESRLVIKSVRPGSSRVITVMSDGSGRVVTYTDQVVVVRDAVSGVGRSVVAFLDPAGGVNGFVQETESTYPALPHDVASLRTLRDSAKTNATRRALNPSEERRVLDVSAFLRKRCPA